MHSFHRLVVCFSLTVASIFRDLGGVQAQTDIDAVWGSVDANAGPSTPTSQDREIATCLCDLTDNACDAGCCCDSDCTDSQLISFTCTEPMEGRQGDSQMCYRAAGLMKFNPRRGLDLVTKGAAKVLCVEIDNNPSAGLFYEQPSGASVRDAELDTQREYRGSVPFLPGWLSASSTDTTRTVSANRYVVGDAISADRDGSDLLSFPSAGAFGECSPLLATPVRYMQDMTVTCTRTPSALDQTGCEVTLASPFPSPNGNNAFSVERRNPSESVSVTINSVTSVDETTGTTTGESDTSFVDTPTYASGTSVTCSNVVVKVTLTMTYDRDSPQTFTPSVDVVITSLTRTTTAAASAVYVPTILEVKWVDSQTSNLVRRSGNPGYRVGSPIVAGHFRTLGALQAVDLVVDSNGYPSLLASGIAPDGTCQAGDPLGTTNFLNSRKFRFGVDASFNCLLSLSLTDLETFCGSNPTGSYALLQSGFSHVGAFGNPDRNVAADWIQIVTRTSNAATSRWDSGTRTCTSIATGVVYEFFWFPYGTVFDPQRRIVSVRRTFTYTPSIGFNALSDSDTVPVLLTAAAVFIKLNDTNVTGFVPPRPPILPVLPQDLFFPFVVNAGGRGGGCPSWVLLLLLCLLSLSVSGLSQQERKTKGAQAGQKKETNESRRLWRKKEKSHAGNSFLATNARVKTSR